VKIMPEIPEVSQRELKVEGGGFPGESERIGFADTKPRKENRHEGS
jgi:hypothetical protein